MADTVRLSNPNVCSGIGANAFDLFPGLYGQGVESFKKWIADAAQHHTALFSKYVHLTSIDRKRTVPRHWFAVKALWADETGNDSTELVMRPSGTPTRECDDEPLYVWPALAFGRLAYAEADCDFNFDLALGATKAVSPTMGAMSGSADIALFPHYVEVLARAVAPFGPDDRRTAESGRDNLRTLLKQLDAAPVFWPTWCNVVDPERVSAFIKDNKELVEALPSVLRKLHEHFPEAPVEVEVVEFSDTPGGDSALSLEAQVPCASREVARQLARRMAREISPSLAEHLAGITHMLIVDAAAV